MNTLHPLATHLPIAVALLWPLVDLVGLWLGRPDVSRTAVGLLGVGILSALIATVTGQAAYDAAIAAGRSPELLDTHGDPAGLVPWALLGLAALRTAGVRKLGRAAHITALVLGFAAAVWVGFIGHTGGRLVYEHGVGVESSP
jgi:uncharacterized membrane protein